MKHPSLLAMAAVTMVVAGNANAALTSVTQDGGQLVKDSDLNVVWADEESPTHLTWSPTDASGSAQAWVSTLNSEDYGGYNTWTLPSSDQLNILFTNELDNPLYPGAVTNIAPFLSLNESRAYWSSTAAPNYGAGWALMFNLPDSGTYPVPGDYEVSALAVTSGDVPAVPLPGSAWLLLSGVAAIGLCHRRFG